MAKSKSCGISSLPRDASYEQPPFPLPFGEPAIVKYVLSDDFLKIIDK